MHPRPFKKPPMFEESKISAMQYFHFEIFLIKQDLQK